MKRFLFVKPTALMLFILSYLQSVFLPIISKIITVQGVTTYHSKTVTEEDSQLADKFMKWKGLEGWNTRLFKTATDPVNLEIRSASVEINCK